MIRQIMREMYSMYLYMGMSVYFNALNLVGFAKWASNSATEELRHANKVIDHLVDRDLSVELRSIDSVSAEYKSPLAAFEAAYKHEQSISADWQAIAEASLACGDYITFGFSQGFVAEQVEEERKVLNILQLFAADSGTLLVEHLISDGLE
jgi:ferritin